MPSTLLRPLSPLRLARQARGWSQRQVAEAVGTNHFTVTRWEQGRAFPSPYFRQQLATLFGLAPEALGLVPRGARQPNPSTAADPPGVVRDPLLPPPLPPAAGLIGREELLAQLKARLFAAGTLVLSALQGLPGVGKTALALALAHDPEVQAHFADGVLWTGLGQTPQVSETLARWGTLLGLSSTETARLATQEAWAYALRTAIGTRQMLFILDDVWHPEDMLACQVGGAGCATLVTTRRLDLALQIAGAGMAVVPELGTEDGLTLLTRLAPAVVETEPEAARRLVQAVGGLPLGLLLLGKHLYGQSYSGQPRRIRAALERLRQSTERLHLAQPQAPVEAHPSLPAGTPLSLQASIGLSVAALPAQAQTMLSALALFPPKPNSFSEEAALAVSAGRAEMLDALVDAGLVESAGVGRYQLHQTIADFAREQRSGRKHTWRLVTFFADYVQAHQRDYDALERESANALTALQAACNEQMPAALIQMATALAPFWQLSGLYETAELYLLRAQEEARRLHDLRTLATILWQYGSVLEQRGEYVRAEAVLQEGLALARQSGSPERLSAMLSALGSVEENKGAYTQAEEYYREGLALARQAQVSGQISRLAGNLATIAFKLGNLPQAEAYYQDGLSLAREMGDDEQTSVLLQGLGRLERGRGNFAQAEACWREALALARQIGHREHSSALLSSLGGLLFMQERNEEAETYLQEALSVAREIGHREHISNVLSNLAGLLINYKRYTEAEAYAREGLALARAIGHRERMCSLLNRLGTLGLQQGNLVQAEASLGEGLALAREMNYAWYTGIMLCNLGEICLKQKRWDDAASSFREALPITREMKGQELLANCFYGLAQVAAAQGKLTEARRLGQESLALIEPMGFYMVAEVRDWLAALPPVPVS